MKQSARRRLFPAATIATLLLTLAPSTALAHGEEGSFVVESAAPADGLEVVYDLLLVYDNDGDPAGSATVTLTGRGPRQATVGPVTLAPTGEAGHYGATVTFPSAGQWRVRIKATSPRALLTRTETVEAPAAPTTAPPTTATAPTTAAPSTAAPSTTGAAPSTRPGSTAPAPAGGAGGGGDGGGGGGGGSGAGWVWLAAVLAIVAAGSTVTVFVRRRTAT